MIVSVHLQSYNKYVQSGRCPGCQRPRGQPLTTPRKARAVIRDGTGARVGIKTVLFTEIFGNSSLLIGSIQQKQKSRQ